MMLMPTLAAAALLAAQGDKPVPAAARAMPQLSASDTVAMCLGRQDGTSRDCIGDFTEACIRLNPDGETSAGMIGCTAQELEAWDAALNEAYDALRARHDGTRATALRDAQRAWIAKRDADCAFLASIFEGGSHAGLEQTSCLMSETAKRTIVLRGWTDNYPPF